MPGENVSVLVVDVGNSRTKFAICERNGDAVPSVERFHACDNSTATDIVSTLQRFVGDSRVTAGVVAGSGVGLRRQFTELWPVELPSPIIVDRYDQIPVDVSLETPGSVGIDRLLNALGAKMLYPESRSIVIVDSGTATTIDLVREGAFLGGAILPGLRLAAISLHDYTAALPVVDSGKLTYETSIVPGKNTETAIGSGIFLAQLGAIKEIVARYEAKGEVATLVFTGGAAKRLVPAFEKAHLRPYLSLRAMASLATKTD